MTQQAQVDSGVKDMEVCLRIATPRTPSTHGGDAWLSRGMREGWGADLFQGGGRQEELSCGVRVGRADLHLEQSNSSGRCFIGVGFAPGGGKLNVWS